MNRKRFDKPLFSDNQKMKDCKKATPDNSIMKGYTINVTGNDLINDKEVTGDYIFDSYDKFDNTIYIIKNGITKLISWESVNFVVSDNKGKKLGKNYNQKHNYIK